MKRFVRAELLVALVCTLCAVLAVASLRAAAQGGAAPASSPAADAPAAPPPDTTPPPPAAPPGKGTGGIRMDDATVAPDKGQSADNNVSFPTDI